MKPSLELQHSAQVLSKEGETEKKRNLQFADEQPLNKLRVITLLRQTKVCWSQTVNDLDLNMTLTSSHVTHSRRKLILLSDSNASRLIQEKSCFLLYQASATQIRCKQQ